MAWTLPFLFVVGVLLPLTALKGGKGTTSQEDLPSLRALALQALLVQAILFGLAWGAASSAGLDIAWNAEAATLSWLAALLALGLGIGAAHLEARRPLKRRDALRKLLRGVNPLDPLWLAVAVAAATAEELAYRGVLMGLAREPLGSWPAALVSASLFGLAHKAQGWCGAVFSACFGLALQGIVHVSGGLAFAIGVHLTYDLTVGVMGRRLARREASG